MIHQKRRVAMKVERRRGKKSAFHAMRASLVQRGSSGQTGGAAGFQVVRDLVVEETLNLRGSVQSRKNAALHVRPAGDYSHFKNVETIR